MRNLVAVALLVPALALAQDCRAAAAGGPARREVPRRRARVLHRLRGGLPRAARHPHRRPREVPARGRVGRPRRAASSSARTVGVDLGSRLSVALVAQGGNERAGANYGAFSLLSAGADVRLAVHGWRDRNDWQRLVRVRPRARRLREDVSRGPLRHDRPRRRGRARASSTSRSCATSRSARPRTWSTRRRPARSGSRCTRRFATLSETGGTRLWAPRHCAAVPGQFRAVPRAGRAMSGAMLGAPRSPTCHRAAPFGGRCSPCSSLRRSSRARRRRSPRERRDGAAGPQRAPVRDRAHPRAEHLQAEGALHAARRVPHAQDRRPGRVHDPLPLREHPRELRVGADGRRLLRLLHRRARHREARRRPARAAR